MRSHFRGVLGAFAIDVHLLLEGPRTAGAVGGSGALETNCGNKHCALFWGFLVLQGLSGRPAPLSSVCWRSGLAVFKSCAQRQMFLRWQYRGRAGHTMVFTIASLCLRFTLGTSCRHGRGFRIRWIMVCHRAWADRRKASSLVRIFNRSPSHVRSGRCLSPRALCQMVISFIVLQPTHR